MYEKIKANTVFIYSKHFFNDNFYFFYVIDVLIYFNKNQINKSIKYSIRWKYIIYTYELSIMKFSNVLVIELLLVALFGLISSIIS